MLGPTPASAQEGGPTTVDTPTTVDSPADPDDPGSEPVGESTDMAPTPGDPGPTAGLGRLAGGDGPNVDPLDPAKITCEMSTAGCQALSFPRWNDHAGWQTVRGAAAANDPALTSIRYADVDGDGNPEIFGRRLGADPASDVPADAHGDNFEAWTFSTADERCTPVGGGCGRYVPFRPGVPDSPAGAKNWRLYTSDRFQFADIDGNGTDEMLLPTAAEGAYQLQPYTLVTQNGETTWVAMEPTPEIRGDNYGAARGEWPDGAPRDGLWTAGHGRPVIIFWAGDVATGRWLQPGMGGIDYNAYLAMFHSGDFDGDGIDEVLVAGTAGDYRNTEFWYVETRSDGSGLPVASSTFLAYEERQYTVGIADFDGDGTDDLLRLGPDTAEFLDVTDGSSTSLGTGEGTLDSSGGHAAAATAGGTRGTLVTLRLPDEDRDSVYPGGEFYTYESECTCLQARSELTFAIDADRLGDPVVAGAMENAWVKDGELWATRKSAGGISLGVYRNGAWSDPGPTQYPTFSEGEQRAYVEISRQILQSGRVRDLYGSAPTRLSLASRNLRDQRDAPIPIPKGLDPDRPAPDGVSEADWPQQWWNGVWTSVAKQLIVETQAAEAIGDYYLELAAISADTKVDAAVRGLEIVNELELSTKQTVTTANATSESLKNVISGVGFVATLPLEPAGELTVDGIVSGLQTAIDFLEVSFDDTDITVQANQLMEKILDSRRDAFASNSVQRGYVLADYGTLMAFGGLLSTPQWDLTATDARQVIVSRQNRADEIIAYQTLLPAAARLFVCSTKAEFKNSAARPWEKCTSQVFEPSLPDYHWTLPIAESDRAKAYGQDVFLALPNAGGAIAASWGVPLASNKAILSKFVDTAAGSCANAWTPSCSFGFSQTDVVNGVGGWSSLPCVTTVVVHGQVAPWDFAGPCHVDRFQSGTMYLGDQ